jgi:hypothetical protein
LSFALTLKDLHCVLAISTSFSDHFGGTIETCSAALSHISEAYRLINERLSSDEQVSDISIAVVTVLAIYQRMHHQQYTGLVHFQGLRQMIQLRGGLARLAKEHPTLAQKPWRYVLLNLYRNFLLIPS